MTNILVLGGTTEASALARLLAQGGWRATLSYAGRTERPRPQPLPMRIGGFGGAAGLVRYLRDNAVTHLVDATHPFATTMSTNAVAAARMAGIPIIALSRPPWTPVDGDRWRHVPDIAGAVEALKCPPRQVMLALGRMHVAAFAECSQHRYLLRFVDEPNGAPLPPHYKVVIDRGPFTAEGDRMLMTKHGIDLVVCKNSGGPGAEAKLIAARELGLPVLMIDRPALPDRTEVYHSVDVLRWLDHAVHPAANRGV